MSKIPKELYVTFKQEFTREHDRDANGDIIYSTGRDIPKPFLLGFANEYQPHLKSFAKKRDTQLEWAYGYGYEDNQGVIWRRDHYEWIPNPDPNALNRNIRIQHPAEQVAPNLQPRILPNEPLTGFRISDTISRYNTSNKLWRILDPRGFELEISTACMEEILMQGGVLKGIIQGACVWRTGKILAYA